MGLSSEELEVLRAWPEFQERLKALQDEREAERKRKAQEHSEWLSELWPLHPGGSYSTRAGKIWCGMCGVVYDPQTSEEYQRLAQLFASSYRFHWYHEEGGNPARKDGDWNAPPDADPLGLRYEDLRVEEESATVEA